jgi:TolA-binding protein
MALVPLFLDATALARPAGRHADLATGGKVAAPTQEDGASYFSENRHGISADALAKADKLRRKTIDSIKDLLDSKKNSVRRFELLLRLGEIYVERHDYLQDLEMDAYAKSWDAWSKDKKGKEPKLDNAGSTAELTKAANSFRQLVTEFPKHPRTDAALYSLGRTLARLDKDTSVDYYKQLIKSFPKSPLLPDTYLSLGEYYFDKHRIPEAIDYYKKVMAFKEHRAYPYAVYKLGWAYYNASAKNDAEVAENQKKAVTAFKLVVKLSDEKKGQPIGNFDLREEAIKDLIMVWADAEDVASAWKYFKTIGAQDSFYKMLERLGNIYADQGKNDKAIVVFQRLLKEAPDRSNNPSVHAKLLELYDLTNNIPQVVVELKNMQRLYLGESPWVKTNTLAAVDKGAAARKGAAKDKDKTPKSAATDNAADTTAMPEDPIAEANHIVELNMHRYGAMFHQRGQKAKSDGYMRHAAAVYTMYLESFASNPNAYDIRYYLAEILYDFKQFEKASDHYLIVAKQDPKGKYMKPAALNAVAAMNQLVTGTKWPQLPPAGQVPSPIEIPKVKSKFVTTIDEYVRLLPAEKDGEPMRFTAAQVFFDYGHYPEALKRFAQITKDIPQTKQAKAAVRVVLGFYGDKQDWNKLIAWSQKFAKDDKLMDPELKLYTLDLCRGAMFKRAQAYEKSAKYEQAARGFLEYQKEFPQDGNADRAVYNAMLNFYKVAKIENALATGQMLIDKYPKSTLLADVIVNQATTYEALAKFDEAAGNYRRLQATFPDDKRAAGALYNAAVLYKGLQKLDGAIELLTIFTARYPNDPLVADATRELGALYERRGRFPEAITAYETYAKRFKTDVDANLMAQAKAATIKLLNGRAAEGKADVDRLRAVLTAKDGPNALDARDIVAGALFKLQEPLFAEFQSTKISDGNKIEQQVTAKQQKLEKLADGYERVIELGSAEHSVASLYRLGEAHENFSQSLFKAPSPPGASQADVDRLKTELEKVAFPLKEEAYKFFETAYKRSREVQTFTAWTRRTYQKMVELAPEKQPAVDELSAEASYLSHDLKLTKQVSEMIED